VTFGNSLRLRVSSRRSELIAAVRSFYATSSRRALPSVRSERIAKTLSQMYLFERDKPAGRASRSGEQAGALNGCPTAEMFS